MTLQAGAEIRIQAALPRALRLFRPKNVPRRQAMGTYVCLFEKAEDSKVGSLLVRACLSRC